MAVAMAKEDEALAVGRQARELTYQETTGPGRARAGTEWHPGFISQTLIPGY